MTTPVNEVVADLVSRLDSNLREAFEERASIREFDGGLTRELAECLALLDVIRQYPEGGPLIADLNAICGKPATLYERPFRSITFINSSISTKELSHV
jgi:hypothetical protein